MCNAFSKCIADRTCNNATLPLAAQMSKKMNTFMVKAARTVALLEFKTQDRLI